MILPVGLFKALKFHAIGAAVSEMAKSSLQADSWDLPAGAGQVKPSRRPVMKKD
jgi:hypothetical protein